MAIEQAIGNIATEIADRFAKNYPNEGTAWTEAARELRFPYVSLAVYLYNQLIRLLQVLGLGSKKGR